MPPLRMSTYYRNQLRELLTQYGELFTVWFDGANGGDGYYGGARETRKIDAKTYYGWEEHLADGAANCMPNAVMFSDAGPDIRWVGNENGFAGDPCWATLNMDNPERYPGGHRGAEFRRTSRVRPGCPPSAMSPSGRAGFIIQ